MITWNKVLKNIALWFMFVIIDTILVYVLFQIDILPARMIALHPSFTEILAVCIMINTGLFETTKLNWKETK